MRVKKLIERSLRLIAPTLIATLAVVGVVSAATTISTDITTGGNVYASSTANVSGLSTLTGGFVSQASSTASGTFTIAGALYASSTVNVTGIATLSGGFIAPASSTIVGVFTIANVGATSTYTGGLSGPTLALTGTATSTGTNGFNLTGGCFSINNTCVVANGAVTTAANTWTALQQFTGFASSSLLSANVAYFGQTATSTFSSAGLGTFQGFVSQASSTVASTFTISGALYASSTANVTSLSTLTGGFVSQASSTVVGTTTIGVVAGSGNSTGLVLGSQAVNQFLFGTCAVSPGGITGSTTVSTTCSATGVNAGSKVFVTPQNEPTGIIFTGASSTGAGVIQVSLYNAGATSSAAYNPGSQTWSWFAVQ